MATRRARTTGVVAGVVAAVVIVGGGLALRGTTEAGSPSASTVQSATTGSTGGTTTGGTASGGTTTATPPDGAVHVPVPVGTVAFDPNGPDLPSGNSLSACRTDGRSVLERYATAALGSVVLQCGNSSQGYAHIEARHEQDWTDELDGIRTRDWDDMMLTAVQTVLTHPRSGLPVDAGDGKVCYAAPILFTDGTPPPEQYVKVIVSATTNRVITAYPTSRSDC